MVVASEKKEGGESRISVDPQKGQYTAATFLPSSVGSSHRKHRQLKYLLLLMRKRQSVRKSVIHKGEFDESYFANCCCRLVVG